VADVSREPSSSFSGSVSAPVRRSSFGAARVAPSRPLRHPVPRQRSLRRGQPLRGPRARFRRCPPISSPWTTAPEESSRSSSTTSASILLPGPCSPRSKVPSRSPSFRTPPTARRRRGRPRGPSADERGGPSPSPARAAPRRTRSGRRTTTRRFAPAFSLRSRDSPERSGSTTIRDRRRRRMRASSTTSSRS